MTDDEAEFFRDTPEHRAIVACAAVSLSLGALEVVVHLMKNTVLRRIFVGSALESIISLGLVVFWAFSFSLILDPANGMAQMYVGRSGVYVADYQATISNANLYFMSWGSGLISFVLLMDSISTYIEKKSHGTGGMDDGTEMPTSPVTGHDYKKSFLMWCLLMVTSAVMVGESEVFSNDICSIEGGTEDSTCNKNKAGFYGGIVGLAIAFLTVVTISRVYCIGRDEVLGFEESRIRMMVDTVAGSIMTVLNAICVGMLTFNDGPATYAGNYYFAAWAGFFLSLSMPWYAVKDLYIEGVRTEPQTAPAPTTSSVGRDYEEHASEDTEIPPAKSAASAHLCEDSGEVVAPMASSAPLTAAAAATTASSVLPMSENPVEDAGQGDENEDFIIDVIAPAGKLGVVLATPEPPATGPAHIFSIRDDSPLQGVVKMGDKVVAVDDQDVRGMTAINVSKLLGSKSSHEERKIRVLRENVAVEH